MLVKSLSEMAGPELVSEFNRRAAVRGLPAVKRFSDRKTAIKRIEALDTVVPSKPTLVIDGSKVVNDFGVRKGTNRQKVLDQLFADFGKQVPRRALLLTLYSSDSESNVGALNMVFSGLFALIKKKRLSYKIVKEKKEKTFGLYPA